MQQLQTNTTLQGGKYRIDRVLGQGGFSNTYEGYNTFFDERVAIKEFFMQGLNDRDKESGSVSVSIERNKEQFQEQREKFKKEAQRIRKLSNPHIIKVHDLFEENGTTYYVMDFIDGESLAERLKRTGAPLSEEEVTNILPQLLDALKTVHDAGIWHLDLKPANIMMDKFGNVKLIDFGASKQLNAQKGGATTSTAISYTNGYAPREQMEQNYDKFGPWTDLYALGATLYTLLTNKRPPLPTDIDDDISDDKHLALPFLNTVSKEMQGNILWLMQTNRNKRPQSIDEFMTMFCSGKNEPKSDNEITSEETIIAKSSDEETLLAKSKIEPQLSSNREVELRNSHSNQIFTDNKDSTKVNNKRLIIWFGSMTILFMLLLYLFYNNRQSISSYEDKKNDVEVLDPIVEKSEVKLLRINTAIGDCLYSGSLNENNQPDDPQGEAIFDDGRYYKGGFTNGILQGENAYFKYSNGDEFKGEFNDNSFYKGTYTIKNDGSYFTGYFKNGQPDIGKWYDKNGNIIE